MNCTKAKATICDWCLQEAQVQVIEEKLWHFWKIISNEDPSVTSHRNICHKCKLCYENFSIYIEECKINTSKIDELLSTVQVKDEPLIDNEYPPLIKTETSNEVDSDSYGPAVSNGVFIEPKRLAGCSNSPIESNDSTNLLSAGKVKAEPFINFEDYHTNEEDVCKQEASDPDSPTVSCGKKKIGLNNCTCTYGGKTLNSSLTMKNHLRTHTGETTFKCSTCNKSFTKLGNLKRHLVTHTGGNTLKCSDCNKSYTRSSYLNVHLRIVHRGEKPFQCSHCNRSFTQSSHLNTHLRIHTGEKPFKCSHCNKRFAQLNTLNRHLLTHTGEKPFKCSHCNKSFSELGNLKRHLVTHTGEKPFKCSHCNKSFTQSTTLRCHSRIHTNSK